MQYTLSIWSLLLLLFLIHKGGILNVILVFLRRPNHLELIKETIYIILLFKFIYLFLVIVDFLFGFIVFGIVYLTQISNKLNNK